LACACGTRTIELPELGDAKSLLLLLEDLTRVEAHDLEAPNRRVPAAGAGALTLLLYDESLVSLGLPEGTLVRHDAEDGRPLPVPARAFTGDLSGEWEASLADQSALFRSFRIAPEPPAQCAARSGCYPDAADRHCVRPCPLPAPPEPPLTPRAPVLVPCPAGWAEVDRASVTLCEPRPGEPELPACASGTHPFLGGACRAIGPPCAADGWPSPPSGRPVIWIRAGASGSGTRDDPIGTIAGAIAASARETVLAVAAGRYPEPVPLLDRELLGACASEVIVEGDVTAGAATIRALTIEGALRVSGSLSLEEAAVTGGIDVDPGASLDARAVVSFVRADAGAAVTITGSVLDAPIAATFMSATATITGTLLAGETLAIGGRLHLAEDELLRRGGAALTSSAAAFVSAEQIVVRGSGRGTAIHSSAGLRLQRAALLLGGSEGNAVSSSAGFVVVDRALIEDVKESALSVERTNLLVFGSRIRGVKRALSAREGAEIHVDTSIVEETTDYAFRIDGEVARPGETYQLEDLELFRTQGGARILRPQIGRLTRVAMIELSGPGIFAEGVPNVVVEDLSLDGVTLACAPAAADCGALAASGGTLDVDRFQIMGIGAPGAAAVRLTAEAAAMLKNGRILHTPVGIAAFGARDARDLLRAVVFEDVGAPCDPCGE
jgi:hypothetical protein